MSVKIWLDDIRPAPTGYIRTKSVNDTKRVIEKCIKAGLHMELDLDHDLGDYANDGGDGICLIKWLIENEIFPTVRLHTMNPVGWENMKALIDRYWPQKQKKGE